MHKFSTIGLIGRVANSEAVETLQKLKEFLLSKDITVVIEQATAEAVPCHHLQVAPGEQLGQLCDLVIVVGGDGSMLSAARTLVAQEVPVLGVNRGRLGFLTDILPDWIEQRVEEVLQGLYKHEDRVMLDAVIMRNGEPIGKADALNDVVLNSGNTPRMIEFELFIDDLFVYSQRSDGLIVATTTGSTAYSLSGGGPIMHPRLNALVLVPMFPHTLSSRPLVIDDNSEIRIVIGEHDDLMPDVGCDGQVILSVQPGDEVLISKKPHKLKLIHPLDTDFYATCRDKLGWGNRLDNRWR
jgi:NAD+ kinase